MLVRNRFENLELFVAIRLVIRHEEGSLEEGLNIAFPFAPSQRLLESEILERDVSRTQRHGEIALSLLKIVVSGDRAHFFLDELRLRLLLDACELLIEIIIRKMRRQKFFRPEIQARIVRAGVEIIQDELSRVDRMARLRESLE